jgi:predicted membrane protein
MTATPTSPFRVTPQIILGLLIVAFGVILTLDNLDYLEAGEVLRYWPLLLVAFGLARLLGTNCTSGRLSGGVMIVIGLWLTADELVLFPLDFERWWPMILVAIGGLIVVRAIRGGGERRGPEAQLTTDAAVSEVAVWSGKVRRITSPVFRRADLTAIMGGVEVDLRGASTGGQEAVIDVFAWWGGIEITVPPDWAVSNQVVVFMGGVDDSSSGTQDARNRLVVRGFVVMGGAEIKTS